MTGNSLSDEPIDFKIRDAFRRGDTKTVRELIVANPEQATATFVCEAWLHRAAEIGDIDLMELLLSLGSDPNVLSNGPHGPPLMAAIHSKSVSGVTFLLEHGADPNIDRTLIGAINRDDEGIGFEIVKLLVEHGADINRVFPWFDDKKVVFTPLSWAVANGKTEIAEYLRSKGATMPPGQPDPGPPTIEDEIVAYFEKKLGPVQPQSQQEIVPTGLPIAIHLVPPSEGRNHITLFTTGMSQQPMKVPPGAEQLQYAELAINLPADWPLPGQNKSRSLFGWLKKSKPPDEAAIIRSIWPFQWLRTIARYPHDHNTWLGGPAVIFANGDPPQPLAPGVPFTSLLMMNTGEVHCTGDRLVQIYQLLPLYTEERALEIAQGIPALLQALDRNNISWEVDLNRPNVALQGGSP